MRISQLSSVSSNGQPYLRSPSQPGCSAHESPVARSALAPQDTLAPSQHVVTVRPALLGLQGPKTSAARVPNTHTAYRPSLDETSVRLWVNARGISPFERAERHAVAQIILRQPHGTHLIIKGFKWITSLPEGMDVHQDMTVASCPNLRTAPRNWRVRGDLVIEDCPELDLIPEDLRVGGHFCISRCAKITASTAAH